MLPTPLEGGTRVPQAQHGLSRSQSRRQQAFSAQIHHTRPRWASVRSPQCSLAARIDHHPPRRALLLARCLGSDHATATGVADRDVLEAPRVRSSPARRCSDRFVVCSTRLETHAGEGRRVDRSDGGCTPSLGPVAVDQPTTSGAAETVVRPRHGQVQVDEVGSCCPAARFSSPRRNVGTPCKSRTHLGSAEKQSAHCP